MTRKSILIAAILTLVSFVPYGSIKVHALMAGGGCVTRTVGRLHGFPFGALRIEKGQPFDEWELSWAALSLNAATFFALTFIVMGISFTIRQNRRERQGRCLKCGYLLAFNESGACPECGTKSNGKADQAN